MEFINFLIASRIKTLTLFFRLELQASSALSLRTENFQNLNFVEFLNTFKFHRILQNSSFYKEIL